MRVKLSEQYQTEREDICDRLIQILDLDEDQSFVVQDLDLISLEFNEIFFNQVSESAVDYYGNSPDASGNGGLGSPFFTIDGIALGFFY